MSDMKSFFHRWCVKKGLEPTYQTEPTGPSHCPRFTCHLRVPNHSYVGSGTSSTKKEATFDAARDFVAFLVRSGEILETDLPKGSLPACNHLERDVSSPATCVRPVVESGYNPNTFGQAYAPLPGPLSETSTPRTFYDVIAQQKNIKEAEDTDLNASIHGNWTIDNAKTRLHQFLNVNQITTDYKFTVAGPQHRKSYIAEMTIPIPKTDRKISARETATTKQIASKSCALSLVRQLYHLNVLKAFSGSLKNKIGGIPPYDVVFNKQLISMMEQVLLEHGAELPVIKEHGTEEKTVLLLSSSLKQEIVGQIYQEAGIVPWAPPMKNWHAWLATNIEENSAKVNLDDLSLEMYKEWNHSRQIDDRHRLILQYREELPVFKARSEIVAAIKANPVIIIRGNTGSGKTTQVCQFILDDYIQSGQGAHCNICVTQPRRIATVSLADRIASERCEELGESVGYSVRFEAVFPRPFGSIFFCTIGTLLRILENGLRGISHVIVDEIHERDINTDFLLTILRDINHRYPQLRVILMSATIDVSMFSSYFNNCPIIEVQGSCFEVKSYFLEDIVEMLHFTVPIPSAKKVKLNADNVRQPAKVAVEDNLNLVVSDDYLASTRVVMSRLIEKELNLELIEAIIKYCVDFEIPGAILIFLTGWGQIDTVMKYLTLKPEFSSSKYLILPLHSHIGREDQRQVFEPVQPGVTKIILSTNIAESSITIDDVMFVIDLGLVKTRIFTLHNNMINYTTVWCSKSSLTQRQGRAGRVRPGYAFHLMSKARYDSLEQHTTPEMLRMPLHQLALSIKLLQLGNVGQFLSKAIEPPPLDAVIEAEILLRQMKCLDKRNELTPLGKILARLPLEPRVGRMLILGSLLNVGDGLLTISGSVSTSTDFFIIDGCRLSDSQRMLGGSRHSDHLASLKVFNTWSSIFRSSPQAASDFCIENGIAEDIFKVISDVKCQLNDMLIKLGFPASTISPFPYSFDGIDENLDTITAVLCMGFYPNVCYHQERRKVLTCELKPAIIHATSINCSNNDVKFPYPFFVFGEKVRTTMVSCKQTSMISPLHLLLFGCNKVELVNDIVRIDNWINFKIEPYAASLILSLRPLLEDLLGRIAERPALLNSLTEKDNRLISVIRKVSLMDQTSNLPEIPKQSMMSFEDGSRLMDSFSSCSIEPDLSNTGAGDSQPRPTFEPLQLHAQHQFPLICPSSEIRPAVAATIPPQMTVDSTLIYDDVEPTWTIPHYIPKGTSRRRGNMLPKKT